MPFLQIAITQVAENLCYVRQIPTYSSQYHGCWWPGDAGIQGISNHDIELVKPIWLGPRPLRVKLIQEQNVNYCD